MRIEVIGRSMEATDAIKEVAEKKAAKLPKYYDGVQEIQVVLDQHGHNEYQVEIRVESEKHDTFVSKDHGTDVYHLIDTATEKMVRQLTDFKEKLKNTKR